MSLPVKTGALALLGILMVVSAQLAPEASSLLHLPHDVEWVALALLALLFAASLMRLGPRKFLRRLWHGRETQAHHHPHGHHHH